MIVGGIEAVANFLRNNCCNSWTIQDLNVSSEAGEKNCYVFKSDKELTPEQNIQQMLANFADGTILGKKFLLKANQVGNQATGSGALSQIFAVGEEYMQTPYPKQTQQQTQPQPQIGVVTTDELERRLAEERNKWEQEQEMKRLREELAEAKAENKKLADPLHRVVGRLEPLVAPLVGALINKVSGGAMLQQPTAIGKLDTSKPIVGNVEETEEEENVDDIPTEESENAEVCSDEEEQLLRLYDEFKKVDANCYELLEAIIKIGISQQPIMGLPYDSVKQMIINQSKQI